MIKFEKLLSFTQIEMKSYLTKLLGQYRYDVISADGYIYAKGELPVLVTSHMDRHPSLDTKVTEIHKTQEVDKKENRLIEKWTSPQGIAGDDRCGIWIITQLLKKGHRPSILFCEDEERGCLGSGKFVSTEHIKNLDVNYMIQIDRRGNNDCVFYSCDNKDFIKWIEEKTGRKEAIGSCSDISRLMPASKIAGVNFSCGYYGEHTKSEYICMEDVNNTIDMLDKLLKEDSQKWEYVEKKYSYGGYGYGNYGYYGRKSSSYYDDLWEYSYSNKSKTNKKNDRDRETQIKLTVYVDEDVFDYGDTLVARGNTKPECWMNLFMDYPELSFGCIYDYEFE